jgi:hypothetical protein
MNSRRSRNSDVIAGELMFAPMVAAMRLPLMAAEAATGTAWTGESMRAVTEKTSAMSEGIKAAQLSYLRSTMLFWPEVLSGRAPSILNGVAAERSITAALKPASRRVKANFRRLSGKI